MPRTKLDPQLALFIEQLPVSIAIFDTQMRYLAVSCHFLSDMEFLFSGRVHSPTEAVGCSHYELFPNMPQHWREIHARVLAGEELAQQEDWVLRHDGCTDCIRWSMKPWRTAGGQIGGALCVCEVITEQIEAKRALADSEVRFRATFENAAAGVAHLSPDLRWLRVNEALCGILGWPMDELLTKSLRDISHPEDYAVDLALLDQMRAGKIDRYDMDKRYLRKDGTIAWGTLTVGCVRRDDGSIDFFVAVVQDISKRKRAEEQVQFLMREANHRIKNILGVVQAIARQTTAFSLEDFIVRFTKRIQALAASQDLLNRNNWRGVDVNDLVRSELAYFADLVGSRITPHGPKLHLNAAAAQTVGLALHELATNAGKYGALSTDAGRVDVSWQIDGDTFAMSWIERKGPPVQPPERRGFGSTVTESMVKQTLGGDVQVDYVPSGLEWHLTCHAADALEGEADSHKLPAT